MMQSQHPPSNNQQNLDDFDEVWVPNPLGHSQENASQTGLIDILKWDNLDSLLTNPWLVSIFVAAVIAVLISAIATTLTSQKNPELTPEQEAQQALLQKSQNLEQTDSNFREYLTRDDNSSGLVSNPGLLQAATLEAGVRYRNRVISSQNNSQNPAYNQHEALVLPNS